MGTTAEKLQAVLDSKEAIKTALEQRGVVDVGDILSAYPQKISEVKDIQCGIGLSTFFTLYDNGTGIRKGDSTWVTFDGTGITHLYMSGMRGMFTMGGQ